MVKNVLALVIVLQIVGVATAAEGPRFALVIGNAEYVGVPVLKNPVNDASDIAANLNDIGWTVTKVTDANKASMQRAIKKFRDQVAVTKNATILFYYSGHGVQVRDKNYLIPTRFDDEPQDEEELAEFSVDVDYLTGQFAEATPKTTIIILDACRDNPFLKGKATRSVGAASRGLASVNLKDTETQSAVIFSTAPGTTASDGTGRNGVFTEAFLKHIKEADQLTDLMNKVTADVQKATRGVQKPFTSYNMSASFYLLSEAERAARLEAAQEEAAAKRQAELQAALQQQKAENDKVAAAARAEAEAAKMAAADALAEKERLQAAFNLASKESAKPKGLAKFESSVVGSIFVGDVLLGEVSPESPLQAESLSLGRQVFRFVPDSGKEETKTANITDKAFTTVSFVRRTVQTTETVDNPLAAFLKPRDPKVAAKLVVFSPDPRANLRIEGHELGGLATGASFSVEPTNYHIEVLGEGTYYQTDVSLTAGDSQQVIAELSPVGAVAFEGLEKAQAQLFQGSFTKTDVLTSETYPDLVVPHLDVGTWTVLFDINNLVYRTEVEVTQLNTVDLRDTLRAIPSTLRDERAVYLNKLSGADPTPAGSLSRWLLAGGLITTAVSGYLGYQAVKDYQQATAPIVALKARNSFNTWNLGLTAGLGMAGAWLFFSLVDLMNPDRPFWQEQANELTKQIIGVDHFIAENL